MPSTHPEIVVACASLQATVSAIGCTAALIQSLHFQISLISPQTVPYVLPVEETPGSADFRVHMSVKPVVPIVVALLDAYGQHGKRDSLAVWNAADIMCFLSSLQDRKLSGV